MNKIVDPKSITRQCNHTIGLASINDEDDEYVEVVEGDSIDFSAGGNKSFAFCPKCGASITHHITDSQKADTIATILIQNQEEYQLNIKHLIVKSLLSENELLNEYYDWFVNI